MSNFLIALLFSLGAGAWVYSKTYRSTGSNQGSSLLLAGVAGFVLFLAMLIVLGMIFKGE